MFKSNLAQREGSQNCWVTLYIRISNRFTMTVASKRAGTSGVWWFGYLDMLLVGLDRQFRRPETRRFSRAGQCKFCFLILLALCAPATKSWASSFYSHLAWKKNSKKRVDILAFHEILKTLFFFQNFLSGICLRNPPPGFLDFAMASHGRGGAIFDS